VKPSYQQEASIDMSMLPYAEEDMPLKWVFQQDNGPKHTSKRPAQSPDLNHIEILWVGIKSAVNEAKSIDDRCEAVIRNRGYATKY
uniref:Tc1-like transposase DDE domain-containing protein n=1 Tax=Echeneis naucrates TaxID=173247 RepID=A0A665VK41_ECHNA